MQRHIARGDTVVVTTVFSHAASPHDATWAARRREDETATARLGATARWLGLLDAPFRDPHYRDFETLTGPTTTRDAVSVDRLRETLHAHEHALRPAVVHVPLAVGDHVDHQLVHAAADVLDARCLYYEDQPYAAVRHAVARRRAELGYTTDEVDRPPPAAEYVDAMLRAPYVRAFLPPGPARQRCERRWDRWPTATQSTPVSAEVERLDSTMAARAEHAIFAYDSQVRALFGSRESYRAMMSEHARAVGQPAPRAERYWHRPRAGR